MGLLSSRIVTPFREDEYKIDNPLQHLNPVQLRKRADDFAQQVSRLPADGWLLKVASFIHLSRAPRRASDDYHIDLDLEKLFQKAAQVAQKPAYLESLDVLTDSERESLSRSHEAKFWNQSKMLRVTIVTLSFSAIVQGWIQSGGNGANQDWPSEFNLIRSDGAWNPEVPSAQWIFAGVNAIPYLSASVFGCWLSDPLQSVILGRRGAIFVSSLLCFTALIGSACTSTWQQLMLCRALVGLGMGAKASVTPIFGAETSPSHLRGALVMNWQLFDAAGIALGFTANLLLLNAGPSLSWRLQFAAASIPSACLLTLIWTIPESPRWLLKNGRYREAFEALRSLRETDLQAAIELFYANAQLQIEPHIQDENPCDFEETSDEWNNFQRSATMSNYFSRIWRLFQHPRTRRATVAASVVMISQQLCGINVIAFYSSTFFRDVSGTVPSSAPSMTDEARSQAVKAAWLSWGVGLANFIFTFPAYFLIDKRGRRSLLLWTYPGMILSMFAACLSFLNAHAVNIKVAFFMFVFVFFYSWGQGPVAFAYSSEVFPLLTREAGMSWAVFVNLLGAGILTLFVPLAQTTTETVLANRYNVSQARLLGIFVGFNVLALILIFLFVPETSGATVRKRPEDGHLTYMKLEELNYIFRVDTRKHMSYQVTAMLPYYVRRTLWYLRLSSVKPERPKKLLLWAEREMMEEIDQETEEHNE